MSKQYSVAGADVVIIVVTQASPNTTTDYHGVLNIDNNNSNCNGDICFGRMRRQANAKASNRRPPPLSSRRCLKCRPKGIQAHSPPLDCQCGTAELEPVPLREGVCESCPAAAQVLATYCSGTHDTGSDMWVAASAPMIASAKNLAATSLLASTSNVTPRLDGQRRGRDV